LGPFIAVNCTAIPEDQIESEFFGATEGISAGKFRAAHHGTLFLDEVGDLSLRAQSKILRILDSGELSLVGNSQTSDVDVRLVASTNKDLKKLIAQGEFREDLFYRLNVVPIRIAPLRERLEDFDSFLERFHATTQKLKAYPWPGNVREFKHFLQRVSILHESDVLEEKDVGEFIEPASVGREASEPGSSLFEVEWKDAKMRFEVDFLTKKLDESGWNVSKTAERIGVERSNLHRRIKSLGIKVPDRSDP
jgi:two-component system nitrogen regulation response regulator NtrX